MKGDGLQPSILPMAFDSEILGLFVYLTFNRKQKLFLMYVKLDVWDHPVVVSIVYVDVLPLSRRILWKTRNTHTHTPSAYR